MVNEPTTRLVPQVQEHLEALKERLLVMGGLAEEQVRLVTAALVERDVDLAARVQASDEPLNALHKEIDQRCVRVLALHQPVAIDLRAVLAAVKINTDLERVGDLAVNVAEAVQRYLQYPPVELADRIPRMAALAQHMLRDALDAYVRQAVPLAEHVLDTDDLVDDLKDAVSADLLPVMQAAPDLIAPALDVILVARHLERIADHATNIAEDVIFMVSARDVRHHGP
ncbi:phosphate transport system regulatory protein PhoU [Luteitalea sp. TBR-22]|uniref:phosphate signaling complex protein PhoU n=1 Tax=Luteitalea sp. TBR-22 TaxID=2802971 RepID=UPI001AFAB6A3|nr:phosphate signaling complex protein PhoU [Luteitalea sp. TBR-22]BCS32910.1 phosphate transport system regulatory protein PhoU [Luteitalea sp. TBR-22]